MKVNYLVDGEGVLTKLFEFYSVWVKAQADSHNTTPTMPTTPHIPPQFPSDCFIVRMDGYLCS